MIELARQPELPAEPVPWLYQAVRFRAINLHRSERRRHEREQAVADQREPFFIQDPASDIDLAGLEAALEQLTDCLLYTSPSPRDRTRSRMPSSA